MNFYEETDQESLALTLTNAVKCQVGLPLKEILTVYTMDKLKVIAVVYDIPNRSKMKKSQLVDAIIEVISDSSIMAEKIMSMDDQEYQFFKQCLVGQRFQNKPVYVEMYSNLCRWGYLYLVLQGEDLYYDMPQEIKDFYGTLDQERLEKQRQAIQEKWNYMAGLANFYGMVTYAEVVDCYNKHNDQPTNVDQLEHIFQLFQQKPQAIEYYQGYLVNNFLLEDDEFDLFLESRADKPTFFPSKEMIMNYADDWYFEMTPELATLRQYMADNFTQEAHILDNFIDDVQLTVVLEKEFQELIDLFESYEFKFASREQVDHISVLLIDILNNTRLWSNRGYTQLELHEINGEGIFQVPIIEMEKPQPIRVEKVGRNELCPCGSGKKFKKCCGR